MAPKDIDLRLTRTPESLVDNPARITNETGITSLQESANDGYDIQVSDYYLHLAESYGIKWGIEKCGRDVFQNFFDANGGTLDGVGVTETQETNPTGLTVYGLNISGEKPFSYKELLHIGSTTKGTGGQTAGGFGEGAKMLSLSLLRDHAVDQIIFRSADWQLEFRIDDMPSNLTDRKQRGLYARVATDLPNLHGSTMTITTRDRDVIHAIGETKALFRSSENPDFQNMTIQKVMPDGTEFGLKILPPKPASQPTGPYLKLFGVNVPLSKSQAPDFERGNLYVAGQRRHYDGNTFSFGETVEHNDWDTVIGMTLSVGRDIAPGDRDRGAIKKSQLHEVVCDFAASLTPLEAQVVIKSAEPFYGLMQKPTDDITHLISTVATTAGAKGLRIGFDKKYIAMSTKKDNNESPLVKKLIEDSGCIPCPSFFANVGMRTDAEFVRQLHEHSEISPSPEQAIRINLIRQAVDAVNSSADQFKRLPFKPIKLYSNRAEMSPTNGTHSPNFVWLARELFDTVDFPRAVATAIHENDHVHGGDETAAFSYALTETLAQILSSLITNPELHTKFVELSGAWQESQAKDTSIDDAARRTSRDPWKHPDKFADYFMSGILRSLEGKYIKPKAY